MELKEVTKEISEFKALGEQVEKITFGLECIKNFGESDEFEIRPLVSGGSNSFIRISKANNPELFENLRNQIVMKFEKFVHCRIEKIGGKK